MPRHPARLASLLAALLLALAPRPAPAAAGPGPGPRVARVATPGISLASLVLALGGAGRLAAASPEVGGNPWLARVFPALAKLPTPFARAAGVNLEELLACRPGLVVLWAGGPALGRRLGGMGLKVLTLEYATPQEMMAAARRLGRALGPWPAARARLFARYYEACLALAARGLAGLPPGQRPRVYYASIAPLRTEGRGSMVDAWISAAGGVNVAARAGLERDRTVHLENVLAWDPQVIIVQEPAVGRQIRQDPRWQGISALRAGRVYVNPRGINAWCTRAAEAALQVLWAAQTLHPGRFRHLDLAAQTRAFYQVFYGYRLDSQEVAAVLACAPPPPKEAAP